jgi:hypothetical protein
VTVTVCRVNIHTHSYSPLFDLMRAGMLWHCAQPSLFDCTQRADRHHVHSVLVVRTRASLTKSLSLCLLALVHTLSVRCTSLFVLHILFNFLLVLLVNQWFCLIFMCVFTAHTSHTFLFVILSYQHKYLYFVCD